MRLGLVGVGGAGGRVVDRVVAVEAASGLDLGSGNALVVDLDREALAALEYVPRERRLALGDVPPAVDEETGDAGADRDVEAAVGAARDYRAELVDAYDRLDLPGVDAVLVVAGLGGAAGGGVGAVVLEQLGDLTDVPLYAVGVLPSDGDGPTAATTAVRALQSFVRRATAVIGFDDEAWCPRAHAPGADYDEANDALARRLVTLFGAGDDVEVEHRLDPADLVRTLEPGGLSSLGHAAIDVPGAGGSRFSLSSLTGRGGTADDEAPDADDIAYLARRAARGKLTVGCDLASAERALIVRSGPSRALAGVGFEDGRYWLEETADTVEVLAGAVPNEAAGELSTVVLLSNVTAVPRLEALKATAVGE